MTWLRRVTRQRVLIHSAADQTFEGLLWEQDKEGVTLRDAALISEKGAQTRLAGEVWIPRGNVLFAQHDG
jgi:hypothetical protein